jgi:hypothetical protein
METVEGKILLSTVADNSGLESNQAELHKTQDQAKQTGKQIGEALNQIGHMHSGIRDIAKKFQENQKELQRQAKEQERTERELSRSRENSVRNWALWAHMAGINIPKIALFVPALQKAREATHSFNKSIAEGFVLGARQGGMTDAMISRFLLVGSAIGTAGSALVSFGGAAALANRSYHELEADNIRLDRLLKNMGLSAKITTGDVEGLAEGIASHGESLIDARIAMKELVAAGPQSVEQLSRYQRALLDYTRATGTSIVEGAQQFRQALSGNAQAAIDAIIKAHGRISSEQRLLLQNLQGLQQYLGPEFMREMEKDTGGMTDEVERATGSWDRLNTSITNVENSSIKAWESLGKLAEGPVNYVIDATARRINEVSNLIDYLTGKMNSLSAPSVTTPAEASRPPNFFQPRVGRQTGGHVGQGQAVTVGERGRETFVPSMSGIVYPSTNDNSAPVSGGIANIASMSLRRFAGELNDATGGLQIFESSLGLVNFRLSNVLDTMRDATRPSGGAGSSGGGRGGGGGGGWGADEQPPSPESQKFSGGGRLGGGGGAWGDEMPSAMRKFSGGGRSGGGGGAWGDEMPSTQKFSGGGRGGGGGGGWGDDIVGGTGGPSGSLIGAGEGGRRSGYTAFNRGTAGVGGHMDFSQRTVGEVMEMQRNRDVFAVGKYQIIPRTMQGAVSSLNIDPNRKFTPELQENIYRNYLIAEKRPAIKAYVTGRSDNLTAAQVQMSEEFASVGDPERGGASHYAGQAGNAASISPEQMARALNTERETYQRQISAGVAADQAWNSLSGGQSTQRSVTAATPPTNTQRAVPVPSPMTSSDASGSSEQTMQLGRGRVDLNLTLPPYMIASKPSIKAAQNFDVGLTINRDTTGSPRRISRPGDPAFSPLMSER